MLLLYLYDTKQKAYDSYTINEMYPWNPMHSLFSAHNYVHVFNLKVFSQIALYEELLR